MGGESAMLVKDKAREDAAKALDETWAAGFPVDPERIAKAVGFSVRRLPLEAGISGLLRVDPDEGMHIYLNSDENPQRQRFTLAHELGHFWERTARGEVDFNIIERRGGVYDLHEFYADEFAGALLMPEHEIRKLQGQGASIARMMRHFDVSLPALRRRLDRLDA